MGWGRGCDGDGVLRLTWVIIVCCRPCASLLWHPVSVQYTSFRDSPCPYKIFIYIYSFLVTSDWLYLSTPHDKGVVAIQSSKTRDERS